MTRDCTHAPLGEQVDVTARLTARSIATGMLIGGLLSICNVYSGLKVGFTTNMSIATVLLGYGLWRFLQRSSTTHPFGLQENLTSQTAGSAAASIAGAGLVAPIPALTMMTGQRLDWTWLASWALSISVIGVLVGMSLRRQLILTERLPFPYGLAATEVLRETYARGREGLRRVQVLIAGISGAGVLKAAVEVGRIPQLGLPVSLSLRGAAADAGVRVASAKNLGFVLDPSVLMIGLGALIGPRAGASMVLGSVLAYAVLAPRILALGWVDARALDPERLWFTELAGWLLWPGVALMVSAALTSLGWVVASSVRRLLRQRRSQGQPAQATPLASEPASSETAHDVPRRWLWAGLAAAAVLSVALQLCLFGIELHAAIAAVVLTFLLTFVAGRVTGETGIAPIGAMGKVTQLAFAGISPGNATANLMSANVTGGAASQCSDMLHDLKTGHLLGAWPRHQAVAQLLGVVSGALCGSAVYLLLIPDPSRQLVTPQWPAPAVAQWKAVAEVFSQGLDHLPAGAPLAIACAAAAGVALTLLERCVRPALARWVPSSTSMGLAFVLPAHFSLSAFAGGMLSLIASRLRPGLHERFGTVLAAGLIAGESLVGVLFAVATMARG
ncbi:MAG: OPT/YSL family transporter [Polyangiaceae bacterium]|nr:OPT/YSL family transporter [Polyangiaceae bacterium]